MRPESKQASAYNIWKERLQAKTNQKRKERHLILIKGTINKKKLPKHQRKNSTHQNYLPKRK